MNYGDVPLGVECALPEGILFPIGNHRTAAAAQPEEKGGRENIPAAAGRFGSLLRRALARPAPKRSNA